MMRFNYIRILLILMLCAGVLSAQGPAVDSLTIIQDTTKSAFPETDSLAAVSLPKDTLESITKIEPVPDEPFVTDSLAAVSLPEDTLESITKIEPVSDEPFITVIEPLLMVLYGGELDRFSFMYKEMFHQEIEKFAAAADLEPILYTELSKSPDIPVIPVSKLDSVLSAVDSTDTGCLSDLCQQKLAVELKATHVLIWKLSQRRGVLKIAMNLKPVGGKSIGKTAHYYWGEPSEVMRRVRRACWDVNNKSYPEELITDESRFQKMWFMTEYYLGMKNTLIGAGALSTGLAVILLQGEEDPGPGIGLPPAWPGE